MTAAAKTRPPIIVRPRTGARPFRSGRIVPVLSGGPRLGPPLPGEGPDGHACVLHLIRRYRTSPCLHSSLLLQLHQASPAPRPNRASAGRRRPRRADGHHPAHRGDDRRWTAASTSRRGRQAARLGGFSQYQPVDGRPAEEQTEVLVWYSPTRAALRHHRARPRAGLDPRDRRRPRQPRRATTRSRSTSTRSTTGAARSSSPSTRSACRRTACRARGRSTPGTMFGGTTRQEPRLPVGLEGPRHRRRLRRRDPDPVQEPALPGQRPAAMGHQRRSARCSAPGYEDTWTDVRRASSSFLAQAGAHRRAARPEARRRHRGAAVRDRGEQRRARARTARSSAAATDFNPGRQRAPRAHQRRRSTPR